MSFFLDFKAKSAHDAKKIVAEAYLPPVVRAFIETALQNATIEEQTGPWHVVAKGHLVEQPIHPSGSQSPSSAELKVEPLFFTKAASDMERERLEKSLSAEKRVSVTAAAMGLPKDNAIARSIAAGERR